MIRIFQRGKKTENCKKKLFAHKTQTVKKTIYVIINFSFSEWFIKLQHKNKQKTRKILLLLKKYVNLQEMFITWIHFSDRIQGPDL